MSKFFPWIAITLFYLTIYVIRNFVWVTERVNGV